MHEMIVAVHNLISSLKVSMERISSEVVKIRHPFLDRVGGPAPKRKDPSHHCPFCDRPFKSEVEVESHQEKEHPDLLFACQECPADRPAFKCVEWSHMDAHLETAHSKVTGDQVKSAVMPSDFRALRCKECGWRWYSQVSFGSFFALYSDF